MKKALLFFATILLSYCALAQPMGIPKFNKVYNLPSKAVCGGMTPVFGFSSMPYLKGYALIYNPTDIISLIGDLPLGYQATSRLLVVNAMGDTVRSKTLKLTGAQFAEPTAFSIQSVGNDYYFSGHTLDANTNADYAAVWQTDSMGNTTWQWTTPGVTAMVAPFGPGNVAIATSRKTGTGSEVKVTLLDAAHTSLGSKTHTIPFPLVDIKTLKFVPGKGLLLGGGVLIDSANGQYTPFLSLLDTVQGDTVWSKTFPSTGFNQAIDMVYDTYTTPGSNVVQVAMQGLYRFATVNINNGQIIHVRNSQSGVFENINFGIAKDTTGSGFVEAGLQLDTNSTSSVTSPLLLSVDSTGLTTNTNVGTNNFDINYNRTITNTPDGGYVVAGTRKVTVNSSTGQLTAGKLILFKVGGTPMGQGVAFAKSTTNKLSLYPNPTPESGIAMVDLQKPTTGTLRIADALGRTLVSNAIQNQTRIELPTLKQGFYVVTVDAGNEVYQASWLQK